jgi:hypothetical protein
MTSLANKTEIKEGTIVGIQYEGKELRAIVIDPNGMGEGQPSIGLGMRISKEYIGISQSALSQRVISKDGLEWLKLPSGRLLRVISIAAEDGNEYKVIEFSDWTELAGDFLKQSTTGKSKLSSEVLIQMIDFLKWFSSKGLYATSYAQLKGAYTQSDDNAITQSLVQANELLIADNEILKIQYDRKCSEVNQLLYKLDAIADANSSVGTKWRHWELEQDSIVF